MEVVEPDGAGHFDGGDILANLVDLDVKAGGVGVEAEGFVEGVAEDFDLFVGDLAEVIEVASVGMFDDSFGEPGVAGALDFFTVDLVEPDAVVAGEFFDRFVVA